MSNPRITGQDTEITVLDDGVPVINFTAVKSFNVTWKLSIKSEDYMGETSPRKDMFFEGLSGQVEVDVEGIEALDFAESVKEAAQDRTSGKKFGIKTTLQFPDGDRAIVNIPDVAFSDIPLAFGGRTEYGKFTLSFEASNGRVVSR